MSSLADADLLHVWETMRRQSLPRRAAALLAAATPGLSAPQLSAMSLGERERRLLQLRIDCFGPRLDCVADCAGCGEAFEFELDARRLADSLNAPDAAANPLVIETGDYRIDIRLPTVDDCIAIADAPDASDAEGAYRLLLRRCLDCSTREGDRVAPEALPAALLQQAAARVEAADPANELLLSLPCPACGALATQPLDMAAFCWAEIEARAPRLLAEVDALASRYGWHEADILALSRVRRDAYLGMALS